MSNYGPRQLERIYTYLQRRGILLASAQACCLRACCIVQGDAPWPIRAAAHPTIRSTLLCMELLHLVGQAPWGGTSGCAAMIMP